MKNNSIDILKKTECTGCSVCEKVCPYNAIEMIETKEGFHYPLIYKNKCTNCGLCVKKCHALNNNFKTDFNQEIYDVRANDDIRMKSSSGGMFTILANYVLENNGYVCGASFSKDWLGVEHIIINSKTDLDKLRGSKYIESSLGNIFIEIRKLLREEKQVLFSGCPCQVSALYSYLGKDYDNLITVDLLCNSVVPQKVWKKYLNELFTDEEIKNIEYISFRDKEKFGWNADHKIYIKLYDKEYISRGCHDIYMQSFLKHLSVKEECLHCKYRKYKRVGDISIGDYWGVKDNDNKGVGLTLINTEKAKYIFDIINSSFVYKDVTLMKPSNGGLNGKLKIEGSRKYFFDNFDRESFNELALNSNRIDVCLIGFWPAHNYGAILTYYALYKLLESWNFSILVLDSFYKNTPSYDSCIKGIGVKFAKKHYNNITSTLSKEELYKLNKQCNIFITASDQLWNQKLAEVNTYKNTEHAKYLYFLDFVDTDKKKIAIATSIGDNCSDLYSNHRELKIIKYYLSLFDHISMREKEGVFFFNKKLNLKADFILDPVFLVDKKEYDNLCNNEKIEIDDYIFCYVYNKKYVEKIVNKIAIKLNKKVIFSSYTEYGFIDDVERWLYLIKNASSIITDGFHGICFSIIYNKPFLCLRWDYHESNLNRINSLLSLFNIKDRVVPISDSLLDENNLINYKFLLYMDYSNINKTLEIEKKKSLNWIKNAIKSKKEINDFKDDIINLLIDENNYLTSLLNTYKIEFEKEIYNINESLNNTANTIFNKISNNGLNNWIKLFGIYNDINYIYLYLFGIKFSIKATKSNIDKISWWIPVKKWRESFRNKFRPDQTRPDQTRPDQTRPDQTRPDQT
ncbi:polysaccharide pyruvyl transferase family protein [Brachyspira pilosicoli]|uniref:polysaccharide pyruvyl transferase family protein n=1 Tax=Brachyspira pilosicoli TaxID=52584 RepID=UPI0012F4959D|nr:polysaccharide pyruvyl transferase family protein [Brachyspira pilosicoli]